MKLSNHKGQYLSEYVILIGLVVAAVIAMQTYVRRGLQGRYREATDTMVSALQGVSGDSTIPLQYEPYYIESNNIIVKGPNNIVTQEEFLGGSRKTTIDNNSAEQYGEQTTLPERYE